MQQAEHHNENDRCRNGFVHEHGHLPGTVGFHRKGETLEGFILDVIPKPLGSEILSGSCNAQHQSRTGGKQIQHVRDFAVGGTGINQCGNHAAKDGTIQGEAALPNPGNEGRSVKIHQNGFDHGGTVHQPGTDDSTGQHRQTQRQGCVNAYALLAEVSGQQNGQQGTDGQQQAIGGQLKIAYGQQNSSFVHCAASSVSAVAKYRISPMARIFPVDRELIFL